MRVLSVKFVLFVSRMERAVAFYRDVLGFKPVMENRYWSEVVLGGVTLGLHGGGPERQGAGGGESGGGLGHESHGNPLPAVRRRRCRIGLALGVSANLGVGVVLTPGALINVSPGHFYKYHI